MEITKEQQEEFFTRSKAFQEEYVPFYEELRKKHQCELVHAVVTVPGPAGIFGLTVSEQVGDLKYKPVPSPLTKEDVEKTP